MHVPRSAEVRAPHQPVIDQAFQPLQARLGLRRLGGFYMHSLPQVSVPGTPRAAAPPQGLPRMLPATEKRES